MMRFCWIDKENAQKTVRSFDKDIARVSMFKLDHLVSLTTVLHWFCLGCYRNRPRCSRMFICLKRNLYGHSNVKQTI